MRLSARPCPARLPALFAGLTLLFGGCGDTGTAKQVREIAESVVTLQTGTTSELRDRRGSGPFREFDVAPDEMVEVLEAAMKRAGGEDGPPWVKVYASRRYREVVAKEFEERSSTYKDTFRTAAIAIVHPVAGDASRSRVEMHHTRRGPFHGGSVRLQAGLPGWIDAELAERAAGGLKAIP